MKKVVLLPLLLCHLGLSAQLERIVLPNERAYWDTLHIAQNVGIWIDTSGALRPEQIVHRPFVPFVQKFIPKVFDISAQSYWLSCPLYNSSENDTAHFYLSFGRHYSIEAYEMPDFSRPIVRLGTGIRLDRAFLKQDYNLIPMSLPPLDSATLYVKIKTFTGLSFKIKPLLLNQTPSLSAFLPKSPHEGFYLLASTIFLGILAFLICYTVVQYLLNRMPAYLYYILYLTTVFLVHVRQIENDLHIPVLFSWEPFLLLHGHMFLAILGQIGYLSFVSNFLNVKHELPTLHWFFKFSFVMVVLLVVCYTLAVSIEKYEWGALIFLFARVLQGFLVVFSAYLLKKSKNPLSRLIATGLLLLGVGFVFNLTAISFPAIFPAPLAAFPVVFSLCGVLAEVLMFSSALGLKSVIMEKERESAIVRAFDAEKELLNARIKLLEDRQRIARDLHDDVGSTLSSISILSESAQRESQEELEKNKLGNIGDKARSALDSIGDIVWSVNPDNDPMEKVLVRMSAFASEMLENVGAELRFQVDEGVEILTLPIEKRKNFYLIFKEAIHNCAKYSQSKQVEVTLKNENNSLIMKVKDNGVGFAPAQAFAGRGGNGLKNMHARAEAIGADLTIESTPGTGTLIQLSLPLVP